MNNFSTLQKHMIGHAMLLMLCTMIAGLGLWMSLLGGFEIVPSYILNFSLPGTPEGWARAHRGIPPNSLMVLGVAVILNGIGLTEVVQKRVAWITVGTGWANAIFYIFSNFSQNRGLSFGSNVFGPGDIFAVIALGPAYLFGILSMVMATYLGIRCLKARTTST